MASLDPALARSGGAPRSVSPPAGQAAAPREGRVDLWLRRTGDWLKQHQGTIQLMQWTVIAVYAALIVAPTLLPLPGRTAHVLTHLTLFAQFVFWGLWWPGVLLSTVLVGRVWCGLLCPEGTLTERASRYGLGRATPRWVMWKGWPVVAFVCTTIYGQMVSVYQYPLPVLLILGGSTVAAIAVGLAYGREKRVWCKFLCPVNGVFNLLAKLAPVHFRSDREAWRTYRRPAGGAPETVNCAPLVPIGVMRSASLCHMCGRCSSYREAIVLARRSPNHEIVHVAGDEVKPWETVMILFGLMGVAAGAFHWTSSDVFIAVKQALAGWLVDHDALWLLQPVMPWWVLTNYPAQGDTMVPLDGLVLIGFVLGMAVLVATSAGTALAMAARALGAWNWRRFHHLAQSLIPLAACGVFLGLSALTVTMLRGDGIIVPFVAPARAALLAGAALWCVTLAWQISGVYAKGRLRRIGATLAAAGAVGVGVTSWAMLFFVG